MVIACPNCKRKYQIDTTRIPVGGTSFTCWSCRATVRVDPLGNTDASTQVAASPTRPALPGRDPMLVSDEADPNVPPSAMRFFESLAAEATLTRQMASDDVAAPDTGAETPRRVTGSIPMDALERLQGDDVLDLPPIEPIPGAPMPIGDVIDLGLPILDDPLDRYANLETATPEWAAGATKTVAFGSQSADDIDAATTTADLPPPRPIPSPISLPPSISVTQPMSALNIPAFNPPAPVETPHENRDEEELMPTAPFERPSSMRAESDVTGITSDAPFDSESAARMTPSEMAVSPQRAWVAPDVQAPASKSKFGLLAIAAVLVVAVCLGLAWQFVLKDLIVGRPMATATPSPTEASTAPPITPVDSAPVAPTKPAGGSSTATDPSVPASTAPETATSVPARPSADSGGFTIQIRSSPNETDAKQFADSLKSAGFDAYVMRADLGAKGIWYRVRVGRFQSREEAQREIGKLRSNARSTEAIIQPFSEG